MMKYLIQKQEKEHRDRLTQSTNKNIKIEQFNIEPGSQLIGQSIQQSGIREKNACLILGIERDGRPIMNLSSQTVFEENDSVWVAGEYRQRPAKSDQSSASYSPPLTENQFRQYRFLSLCFQCVHQAYPSHLICGF